MYSRKVRACAGIAAGLLLGAAVQAQEPGAGMALTVDDAVRLALDGNTSLKQGAISLQSAREGADYAWNSLIPSVSASAGISGRTGQESPSISVGASASLRLTPSLYTTMNAAHLSYERQQLDYDGTVRSVELNVRKSYYALLYEQENMTLLQSNVAKARRQYESNLAKYNRGTLARLDVLTAQVNWQNAQLSYENAQITWQNDINAFKQTLGLPQDAQLTLSGSLDQVLSLGAVSIDDITPSSATVASLQKQQEIAQNSLLATRLSAWGPSLSASYQYSLGGTLDTGLDTSQGGTHSWSLSLSIPLDGYLPWSSGARSIKSQQGTLDSLALQLQDAQTSLDMSIQGYLRKIEHSQGIIALRQSSISLAEQTYTMNLDAYNHGTKDLLSLQASADSLTEAQVSLKAEAYTLISTILDLENALGVPFGTLTAQEAQ